MRFKVILVVNCLFLTHIGQLAFITILFLVLNYFNGDCLHVEHILKLRYVIYDTDFIFIAKSTFASRLHHRLFLIIMTGTSILSPCRRGEIGNFTSIALLVLIVLEQTLIWSWQNRMSLLECLILTFFI